MSVLDKSISMFFVGDIYDRPMESSHKSLIIPYRDIS